MEDFDAPDQVFTSESAGEFSLPDGREWEQVSPADKHGTLFYKIGEDHGGPIQASAAGNAIAMGESQPSEAEPQGYGNYTSALLTRTATGWSSQVIEVPHDEPLGPNPAGVGLEYRLFSADLSHAIVQPYGTTLLSPEASEATAYIRTDHPRERRRTLRRLV